MNHCKWLMIGSITPCNKSCRNEFCGYHMQSFRRGSLGPLPCILCGVGVRGKSQLCLNCGGKRYRELKRYYDKRIKNGQSIRNYNPDADKVSILDADKVSIKDKIIRTPQDYIERFIIKPNNELDKQ